jgi:hypothetical protein
MKIRTCALIGALFVCAPAMGQTMSPLVAGAPDAAVLRAGTSVPLKMAEALTTNGKKLKVGQRFQLETAEPITVNGMTVIPAGSPATGEVTEVRNKGMWGKSGRINARVLFVRANGRQIRMSGQLDDKGTTGTAGVVGAIAVIPVAGFFVTGTSANIPLGAPVTGFIDEDVPVAFADGAPKPMVVAPVAPAQVEAPLKVSTAATPATTK